MNFNISDVKSFNDYALESSIQLTPVTMKKDMDITISYSENSEYYQIRIKTDKRFCAILIDWLTPYVKREIKRAIIKYDACSYREAFDQVLIKENSIRSDKFQIYQEIIDAIPDYDLAKINE